VRLDVSRAAQLSTGIWEAAAVSQHLIVRLGDDWSPPPQLPTGSGKPASSLGTAADTAGLVAVLTTSHSLAAAPDGRPDDVAASLDAAAELVERFSATGEVDSLGFALAPIDVGVIRMWHALEAKEPDRAVSIAQNLHPERHPRAVSQAYYWMNYGRALAQLRGRRDDAVRALRNAEDIFPTKVHRDPLVRDAIATPLPGMRRDAIGTELRRMAHRAGLPT